MSFFRNFGDELVLLNSDYHKKASLMTYNMHKFDSKTGQMIGFREKIFFYDGLSNFRKNISCSTFTDSRNKSIAARCVISN